MTIRRSITVAALAGGLLASAVLPAAGAEPDCLTVHIDHGAHGPQVVETEGWPELSFPGRLGDSIWFQWDADPIEVDVSDPTIDRVVGCTDGSVVIVHDWLDDVIELAVRVPWFVE